MTGKERGCRELLKKQVDGDGAVVGLDGAEKNKGIMREGLKMFRWVSAGKEETMAKFYFDRLLAECWE